MRKRIGVIFYVALLLLLVQTGNAEAHALLIRSVPSANAELSTTPASIELWFSEPLEAKFSNVYLEDTTGNKIVGESIVDSNDATHLTLHVGALQPSIYTVVYRSLSQADGHEWIGSFPIVLLNADGSRPRGAAIAESDELQQNSLPKPIQILSRWLSLLGGMLLLGVVLFDRIAVTPGIQGFGNETWHGHLTHFNHALRRSIKVGTCCGVGLLFSGIVFQVAGMAQSLEQSGSFVDLLSSTRSGNVLILRLLLTGLLAISLCRGHSRHAHVNWFNLLLCGALLMSFPLMSHAAAVTGSGWAMLGDFVHLLMAAIWLGNLFILASLLWQLKLSANDVPDISLRFVVQRFSAIATVSLFVLLCSGIFCCFVQLPSVSLLWTSTYGWVLLGKLLLILLMLVVALFNHRFVHQASDESPIQRMPVHYRSFSLTVWAETLAGIAVVLLVAVLVQTPIPKVAATGVETGYFQQILTADDLNIHLQILPNRVGENQFVAHLYHADGSTIGDVQLVRLSFQHQVAELGQSELELQAKGNGIFAGRGAYLSRGGLWNATLYIRRRALDDILVQTAIDVPIVNVAEAGSELSHTRWQNPIPNLPHSTVLSGVLITFLLAIMIWHQMRGSKV